MGFREIPDGFVFALKGPRYAVNRRVLKEAGDLIKRFLDFGITELGDELGPLLWQFAPSKKFDEADFGGFLELLPKTYGGRTLRHVVEVRHNTFKTLRPSSRCCANSTHRWYSRNMKPIPPSPMSPATSSMRGYKKAMKN